MGSKTKETATTRKLIGKFARTLLATTCLTAATGGAALATTVYPPYPAGEDPTVFSPLTVLAADPNPGTTIISVTQDEQSAWFELTGLGSGTFTFSATTASEGSNGDFFFFCPDASFAGACQNVGFTASGSPLNLPPIAIPESGNLFITSSPRFEQANSYTVTVTTQPTAAPEPSTVAMEGLGLAALTLLARKSLARKR